MAVLNVAFIGSESLAKKIAKKGDVRDIDILNDEFSLTN